MDTKANPANKPIVTEDTRIPMSVPLRKLETREIPGYHQHWMADRDGRINQALRAGYQFVEPEEIGALNVKELGSNSSTGNHDLGTRVSMNSGGEVLYLMKIKKEWYEEDQKKLAEINDRTMDTIRRGVIGSDEEDKEDRNGKTRYGKVGIVTRSHS